MNALKGSRRLSFEIRLCHLWDKEDNFQIFSLGFGHFSIFNSVEVLYRPNSCMRIGIELGKGGRLLSVRPTERYLHLRCLGKYYLWCLPKALRR
jgi:hypothetical protein